MAYKTPISVLVCIYTPDLQVLLLERADKPGFWQSVTGSVEAHDASLHQTAIREVFEETGLNANNDSLVDWQLAHTYEIFPHWRHRYAPGVTHNCEHIFGLQCTIETPITLNPAEHLRYEWVDYQVAAQRVFSWTNVAAIAHLAQKFKKPLP